MSSAIAKERKFAQRLFRWASRNSRDFPWRRNLTPYRILIAEQLLRKTTAKQVDAVYDKFLKLYPGPKYLARARPQQIERVIRPLGMEKKRSVTLGEFARDIERRFQGKVPGSREILLTIPGVGEYAADAVLSLAKNIEVPMVDRNVVRVVSRVFSLRRPHNYRRAVSRTRAFMLRIMRGFDPAKLNLGVLDFAAAICTARKPRCLLCPMQDLCDFYRRGFATK